MTKHILFFEKRIEGHHLVWLPMLAEVFLDLGYELTLAIDERDGEARRRIESKVPDLLSRVRGVISVYDTSGKLRGGSVLKSAAECLEESGADEVFFNSLDEFTSSAFRNAVFGVFRPPEVLRGKISGVYVRPRPLDKAQTGLNTILKRRGWQRLVQAGWFKEVFLLDEFLARRTGTWFLPDPWREEYGVAKDEARRVLGIPKEAQVFLHYGTGSKRKGLSLLMDAAPRGAYLLVAGDQGKQEAAVMELERLEERGRARLLNRYVSAEEEALCFCATDWVMLPYLKHYGSSSVLSLAAAAGRPVIASDYGLVGRRVKEQRLGMTFKNGNVRDLKRVMELAEGEDASRFHKYLGIYKDKHAFSAFKKAVARAYPGVHSEVAS